MTHFSGSYTIRLYHKKHVRRRSENAFVDALKQRIGITEIVEEQYSLEDFKGTLEIASIIESLEMQPLKIKKAECLRRELRKLPDVIMLFLKPSQISCDVVVVKDHRPYFIEYHESQHYSLKDDRPKKVYTIEGDAVFVPRYVQRFLRDVWRMRNLHPFHVVSEKKFKKDGLIGFRLSQEKCTEYCLEKVRVFS